MSTKSVVVLIGIDNQTIDILDEQDLSIFLVCLPNIPTQDILKRCEFSLICDYTQIDNLAENIRAVIGKERLAFALSYDEPGLLLAAEINSLLGLDTLSPETVQATRNKMLTRALIPSELSVPAREVVSRDDAIAFGNETGWPIIIKPINGVASLQVFRADSPATVRSAFFREHTMMAEAFVSGRLFCVDCMSDRGQTKVLCVSEEHLNVPPRYGSNPWMKTSIEMPADISDDLRTQIESSTLVTLKALGIHSGPSHTELIASSEGLRVIETHNRLGAFAMMSMMQRGLRTDPRRMIVDQLLQKDVLRSIEKWSGALCIIIFVPPPGKLTSVLGLEAAKSMPFVAEAISNKKPGDVINSVNSDNDCCGYIFTFAPTLLEAKNSCRAAVSTLKFKYESMT